LGTELKCPNCGKNIVEKNIGDCCMYFVCEDVPNCKFFKINYIVSFAEKPDIDRMTREKIHYEKVILRRHNITLESSNESLKNEKNYIQQKAFENVYEQGALKDLFKNEKNFILKQSILKNIHDQSILRDLFKEEEDFILKQSILFNIIDQNVLKDLFNAENDTNLSILIHDLFIINYR